MIVSRTSALLAAAASLALSAGAFAQGMPMPPSANDPPPAEASRAGKAARPATKPPRAAAATRTRRNETPTESSGEDVKGRVDMRSTRDRMELEDDPRVSPTMQNGRAGVGMRF